MNVSVRFDLNESDVDFDLLKIELSKHGLSLDKFFNIVEETVYFKDSTTPKFKNLAAMADCSYSPACFYQKNGDPGWPEEHELDDLDITTIEFEGKRINVLNILTPEAIENLESKLWEEYHSHF
jgi:hypothetical protein